MVISDEIPHKWFPSLCSSDNSDLVKAQHISSMGFLLNYVIKV
jgi:hypothetical protein